MDALFTRADYLALPEGFPAQLIEGCLVKEASPLYGHQQVVQDIHEALTAILPLRRVMLGPLEVSINDWNSYHPDVAVFREVPPADERGTLMPLAVFEVLSKSTERFDRGVKRKNYLKAGVLEVWLADRAAQTLELHSRDGVRTATGTELLASAVLAGFSLVPAILFAPPH